MGFLITAGQLILSLSILIVLHELGHFIPAKLFGTRVEKFYLFFDPYFSLFKFKKGETEYGIGWLPLGGYVKISGMIDESMDREQMKQPPQPYEFRSKKAWQRLIIMLGGVTVNFLLGFFIWGLVFFGYGTEYLPAENATYGLYADSLGVEMGLQNGDKILKIDNTNFTKFNDKELLREIVLNDAKNIVVDRNGSNVNIPIDPKFIGLLSSSSTKDKSLFWLQFPFIIESVEDGPAKKAGLLADDQVIAIDGKTSPYYVNFQKAMIDYKRAKRTNPLNMTVIRNKQDTLPILVTPKNGLINVYAYSADNYFKFKSEKYGLGEAMVMGTKKGVSFLGDQIKAFGQMFRGKIKASESLGGFGSIGKMFGDEWDWQRFWTMTAILSLILAFMNLLPIPALDGGHVMFLLWEIITGRKPSDRFMEIATIIGFVIVIGLVLFANGMDIFRAFFQK